MDTLAERDVNTFAVDTIPQILCAQTSDALSHMANARDNKVVLEDTYHFGRYMTG